MDEDTRWSLSDTLQHFFFNETVDENRCVAAEYKYVKGKLTNQVVIELVITYFYQKTLIQVQQASLSLLDCEEFQPPWRWSHERIEREGFTRSN